PVEQKRYGLRPHGKCAGEQGQRITETSCFDQQRAACLYAKGIIGTNCQRLLHCAQRIVQLPELVAAVAEKGQGIEVPRVVLQNSTAELRGGSRISALQKTRFCHQSL